MYSHQQKKCRVFDRYLRFTMENSLRNWLLLLDLVMYLYCTSKVCPVFHGILRSMFCGVGAACFTHVLKWFWLFSHLTMHFQSVVLSLDHPWLIWKSIHILLVNYIGVPLRNPAKNMLNLPRRLYFMFNS